MGFKGRLGRGNTALSLAKEQYERWARNRSTDKLLDKLVPQDLSSAGRKGQDDGSPAKTRHRRTRGAE